MRTLAHNLISHPIAGVLWAVAELARFAGAERAAVALDTLGERVHAAWEWKP